MSNLTFADFVRWSIAQINPAALSELMTAYDFTDDSLESVIKALTTIPQFQNDFGELLGKSMAENEAERAVVTGNVTMANNNMTLNDWAQLSDGSEMLFATDLDSASKTTGVIQKNYDWATLINGIVGTATSFFFGNSNQSGYNAATLAAYQAEQAKQAKKSKQTSLYIIIGVVVVVISVIVVLALKKK